MRYVINIILFSFFFLLLSAMPSKDQATAMSHMPYDQWMTQSFADQIPDISCNSSNVPQPQLGAETFWRRSHKKSHWVIPFLRHHNACVTLEGRRRGNGPSWLDSHFQILFKTQAIFFLNFVTIYCISYSMCPVSYFYIFKEWDFVVYLTCGSVIVLWNFQVCYYRDIKSVV